MTALVLPFFDREIIVAYRVLKAPGFQDALALKLACSNLVTAIKNGTPAPPDSLDRLVVLALWGPAPLEFRLCLAGALAAIRDARVQGRALAQIRDPASRDHLQIAVRLLETETRRVTP